MQERRGERKRKREKREAREQASLNEASAGCKQKREKQRGRKRGVESKGDRGADVHRDMFMLSKGNREPLLMQAPDASSGHAVASITVCLMHCTAFNESLVDLCSCLSRVAPFPVLPLLQRALL